MQPATTSRSVKKIILSMNITWILLTNHQLSLMRNVSLFRSSNFILHSIFIRGTEWGGSTKNCNSEQMPLAGSTYPAGTPASAVVVNKVLNRMKTAVYLLDITFLSQLRKDAHPSVYSGDHPGVDCSHWCLPGLPDTWNQLLYAALIMWGWTMKNLI